MPRELQNSVLKIKKSFKEGIVNNRATSNFTSQPTKPYTEKVLEERKNKQIKTTRIG